MEEEEEEVEEEEEEEQVLEKEEEEEDLMAGPTRADLFVEGVEAGAGAGFRV